MRTGEDKQRVLPKVRKYGRDIRQRGLVMIEVEVCR